MLLTEVVRLNRHEMQCIDLAIAYIEKHYWDRISAEDLSQEVGLSKKKLYAGFLKKTGSTPHCYQTRVRIEKAKSLLEDARLPIKSVARTLGYKTHSHFSEVFKEITALTPEEYRRVSAA
jgi:transcriptional regulator GlxA family with amidase domain